MAEKKTKKKAAAKPKAKKLPPNPKGDLGTIAHTEMASLDRAIELVKKFGCHATKKRGPKGEILVYCNAESVAKMEK